MHGLISIVVGLMLYVLRSAIIGGILGIVCASLLLLLLKIFGTKKEDSMPKYEGKCIKCKYRDIVDRKWWPFAKSVCTFNSKRGKTLPLMDDIPAWCPTGGVPVKKESTDAERKIHRYLKRGCLSCRYQGRGELGDDYFIGRCGLTNIYIVSIDESGGGVICDDLPLCEHYVHGEPLWLDEIKFPRR